MKKKQSQKVIMKKIINLISLETVLETAAHKTVKTKFIEILEAKTVGKPLMNVYIKKVNKLDTKRE